MKNIFLTLTFLASLSVEAMPLTSAEPNAKMNTSAGGDRSSTAATTTAPAFDCPACRAAEARSRGATGRTPQRLSDATNPSLSTSRQTFIPGLTPLRNPEPANSGQDSPGSTGSK